MQGQSVDPLYLIIPANDQQRVDFIPAHERRGNASPAEGGASTTEGGRIRGDGIDTNEIAAPAREDGTHELFLRRLNDGDKTALEWLHVARLDNLAKVYWLTNLNIGVAEGFAACPKFNNMRIREIENAQWASQSIK